MATLINSSEIVTFTGKIFDPLKPDPELIDIYDIAHALSNSCRFTGHSSAFYSVSNHSIIVSEIVQPENALTGLLHDASEAYLSDIARPIKQQPGFGEMYRSIEDNLMEAIAARFDVEWPIPADVVWADNVLLRSEQRDLMPNLLRHEGEDYLDFTIVPLPPHQAEEQFINRYVKLTGEE